jgi:glucose/mannose transport system substrate-binding protein
MRKGLILTVVITLCAAGLVFGSGQGEAAPAEEGDLSGEVEVLHWWTSGGEAAAVEVLKEQLEEEGHEWVDFAVAGGGGDAAMTALRSRAVAGNPPTAAQVKGPQIQDWAAEGFLANLDGVAEAQGWDERIPEVVSDIMKYDGNWVAVPVNVHRINWMWVNPDVFEAAGVEIPTTWDEFEDAAEAIEDAGYIPVAWGGQDWQEATVFETIVAGVGGTDFYEQTMVEADPDAIDSDTMVEVFETLRMVHSFTDPGAPGRDWNLATSMVIEGEAAMQFMGDWAKGEFTNADMEPGVDYMAVAAPQTEDQFLFNIDSFIMFEVEDPADKAAQRDMARLILEPSFQETFNNYKGSIPVRMGMPEDPFDAVAVQSMRDFERSADSGDLVPSMAHEMAVARAVRGAMLDTVTTFVNSDMSPEEAADALASAVSGASM